MNSLNLGMNSANTQDWLEVTKDLSVSELIPRNLGTESSQSASLQVTTLGAQIPVPTNRNFLGDLKKASRKSSRMDK